MFTKKFTNILSTLSAFLKTLSHLLYKEKRFQKTFSFFYHIVIIVVLTQLPFANKLSCIKPYSSPNM